MDAMKTETATVTKTDRLKSIDKQERKETQKLLPRLNVQKIIIHIEGDSELICNRFSPEQEKKMLDKQMGIANAGKEMKDPDACYKQTLYPHPDGGCGFPGSGLRKSAISACTSLGKDMPKTKVRQSVFIMEDMLEIEGEPYRRQDVVRLKAGGVPDIRFRASFKKWKLRFTVRFNANVLSQDQVINLFNVAGFAVGIGDWRPEKNGSFGQFHVTKIESSE